MISRMETRIFGGLLNMWLLLVVFSTMVSFMIGCANADTSRPALSLEIMHKFSDKAREVLRARNNREEEEDVANWPAHGSMEYYEMLRYHDIIRHGSRLLVDASSTSQYFFAPGNLTLQLFGGLHYAFIDLGTPKTQFLVALDTGSDLLWIPCECQECAPLSAPSSIPVTSHLVEYSPTSSSTSKPVSCSDALCDSAVSDGQCTAKTDQCGYQINYVSANTSTTGFLFSDQMWFVSESGSPVTSTAVTFGCASVQTGAFLQGAAPDGLLGLGMLPISVPSTLASSKTLDVADSFSFCTSSDSQGSGRIVFGDLGPSTQQTAPISQAAPGTFQTYFVTVASFLVGESKIPMGSDVLFDTGTSYTYLASSTYSSVLQAYTSQTSLPALTGTGWDLCFQTSSSAIEVPIMSLAFPNGDIFEISYGLLGVYDSTMTTQLGFCVGIMDSGSTQSIIGQNFMTNYSITFNRQDMLLGWTASDCQVLLTGSTGVSTPPTPSTPSTPPIPSTPSTSLPAPVPSSIPTPIPASSPAADSVSSPSPSRSIKSPPPPPPMSTKSPAPSTITPKSPPPPPTLPQVNLPFGSTTGNPSPSTLLAMFLSGLLLCITMTPQ
ncbi:hypothetical protein BDL97_08G096500 [Sphagnum fallax]|nr:hypothetical protein BDL97_08G096500 [Sphagnum fallax]